MKLSKSSYSAVVIGCGFMGSQFNEAPSYDPHHTHAASYNDIEGISLIGVCDPDQKRSKEAADYWGVKDYTDAQAMLNELQPDFVSIASPTSTHAEVLDMVLKAPSVKAVLCEKPITMDNEESKRLVEQAKKNNIFIGVNYSRRYNDGFKEVKKLIDDNELGDIQSAQILYQNGLLNNGSHFIDLFQFLLGDVVAVHAEYMPDADYSSDLSGVLEFENGIKGYMQGISSSGAALAEIDIIGTKGRIRTEQCGHCVFKYDLEPSPIFPDYNDFVTGKNISKGMIDSTYNAIQDLLDCLAGTRKAPRCSGADAIKTLEVVEAMIKSAKINKKIEIGKDE